MMALRYERPSKGATRPTRAGIGYPSSSLPPEGVAAMPEREHYDAIVIGSGQGGTLLATALARADRATALTQMAHVGNLVVPCSVVVGITERCRNNGRCCTKGFEVQWTLVYWGE